MNSDHPSQPESTLQAKQVADSNKLPLPSFGAMLHPKLLFSSFFQFIECWFLSRRTSRLLIGMPAIVIAIGGPAFLWWLYRNTQQDAVARYEQAVNDAVQNEDPETAGLYLHSLVALRPNEERYRFNLALFNDRNGTPDVAWSLMLQLAPLHQRGYTQARIWLVEQSLSNNPQYHLSQEEIRGQLQRAVKERPADARANTLLADYYITTKQPRLAEQLLKKAADSSPAMFLPLARLQQSLNRRPGRIKTSLEAATEEFQKQLSEVPQNVNARIQLSECWAMQREWTEAEALLREGIALDQTGQLQKALSQLLSGIAEIKVRESPLNASMARRLLIEALTQDASNLRAISQLSKVAGAGSSFSEKQIQNVVTFWQKKISEKPENVSSKLVFAELLTVCRRYNEAIEQLESVAEDRPDVRLVLAKLYAASNRNEESDRLYDQLLLELQQQQTDGQRTLVAQAALLFQAGRLNDARSLIREHSDRGEVPETDHHGLNNINGRVLVAMADRVLENSDPNSSIAALNMLSKVIHDKTDVTVAALIRIANLSCSNDPRAAEADVLLTQVLAQGTFSPEIYKYIGTSALQANQFRKARRHLETAKRLTPSDPQVLNNLALALIRSRNPEPQKALSLAENVLQIIPENPDVLSTRAEILIALERWEEADRDLQTVLSHQPSSIIVRQLLIVVCEKLGRTALALEHRRILSQLEDKSKQHQE